MCCFMTNYSAKSDFRKFHFAHKSRSIAIIGIDALQEILKRRSYGLLQEALSSR